MFRTYWRQRRAEHMRGTATCIQRMQEALTQMNAQLANVISDISGLTGGERMLKLGEPLVAYDVVAEGMKSFP